MRLQSIRFILRPAEARQNGEMPVYLRLRWSQAMLDLATGIWISTQAWCPSGERVREAYPGFKAMNHKLTQLRERALSYVGEAKAVGRNPARWLQHKLGKNFQRLELIEFLQEKCASIERRGVIEKPNYKELLLALREYRISVCREITYESIDELFILKFGQSRPAAGSSGATRLLSTFRQLLKEAQYEMHTELQFGAMSFRPKAIESKRVQPLTAPRQFTKISSVA